MMILFLLISGFLFTLIRSDEDTFHRIIPMVMLFPIWFILFCIIIYPLFLWNERLKSLYEKIFNFPLEIMFKFSMLQTNIFMVIMFLIICLMPIGFSIILLPEEWAFKWGLVYIISLSMLLLYTYKTQWILRLLDYITNSKERDMKILQGILQNSSPRIISYSMMIIIYVIYNFDAFSNNYLGIDINLVKEVFVTFIAVDTLIQIYFEKRSKN